MFFPKQAQTGAKIAEKAASEVFLKDDHICFSPEMAKGFFGETLRAEWVYYPERDCMFIAGAHTSALSKLHKTSQQMLKVRNRAGGLSLYVLETLLDHELPRHNRNLHFTIYPKLQAVSVQLKSGQPPKVDDGAAS